MPQQEVRYSASDAVVIEIKNLSPNVLAYAIYTRPPGSDWSTPIQGDIHSGEAQAEAHELGVLDEGTELFVSLGFAGTPGGGYKGEVDILQNGKSVGSTGTFFREGKRPAGETFAIPNPCEGVFRAA